MQALWYNYRMVITWYGLSSFKIASGSLTLITDPFSASVGLLAPRGGADIVVVSNRENPAYNNAASLGDEKTFVADGAGEYDVKGLFIHGGIGGNGATIYAIRMEDIRLGFLGALKTKEMTEAQLADLGEVDILFVPVGGHTVCDAEEASKIVSQVEPTIVIPMHFAQKGLKMQLDKVETFQKEMSSKTEPQDKLTIKRSELAPDGTKVIVLNPQR